MAGWLASGATDLLSREVGGWGWGRRQAGRKEENGEGQEGRKDGREEGWRGVMGGRRLGRWAWRWEAGKQRPSAPIKMSLTPLGATALPLYKSSKASPLMRLSLSSSLSQNKTLKKNK